LPLDDHRLALASPCLDTQSAKILDEVGIGEWWPLCHLLTIDLHVRHTDRLGEFPIEVLGGCLNKICSLISLEARGDLVKGKLALRRTSLGLHLGSALCAIHARQKLYIVKVRGGYALPAEEVLLVVTTGLVHAGVAWLVSMVWTTNSWRGLEGNGSTNPISIVNFLQNRSEVSAERSGGAKEQLQCGFGGRCSAEKARNQDCFHHDSNN